jgi:hypothetical protein
MKNKELIEKIQKKIKVTPFTLKKTMKIFHSETDIQEMTQIINDDNELCLAAENDNWIIPLTELTNKELIFLKKCI